MRVIVWLLVTAGIFGCSASQASIRVGSKEQKLGTVLTAQYDRFSDKITIKSKPQMLYGAESHRGLSLSIGVIFTCQGDTLARPDTLGIYYIYTGREWAFLRESQRSLVFMLGDERVSVPVLSHQSDVWSGGIVNERMVTLVPWDLTQQLFHAGADGQLGDFEFDLGHPKTDEFFRQVEEVLESLPPRSD
jgi:hypothetical protein